MPLVFCLTCEHRPYILLLLHHTYTLTNYLAPIWRASFEPHVFIPTLFQKVVPPCVCELHSGTWRVLDKSATLILKPTTSNNKTRHIYLQSSRRLAPAGSGWPRTGGGGRGDRHPLCTPGVGTDDISLA